MSNLCFSFKISACVKHAGTIISGVGVFGAGLIGIGAVAAIALLYYMYKSTNNSNDKTLYIITPNAEEIENLHTSHLKTSYDYSDNHTEEMPALGVLSHAPA